MFELEHHFLAFIGSMSITLSMLRDYVNDSLKSGRYPKISRWAKPRMILVLINFFSGQIIVVVQKYAFDLYADVMNSPSASDIYIDHSEIISFSSGMMSTLIIGVIISKFKSKLKTV